MQFIAVEQKTTSKKKLRTETFSVPTFSPKTGSDLKIGHFLKGVIRFWNEARARLWAQFSRVVNILIVSRKKSYFQWISANKDKNNSGTGFSWDRRIPLGGFKFEKNNVIEKGWYSRTTCSLVRLSMCSECSRFYGATFKEEKGSKFKWGQLFILHFTFWLAFEWVVWQIAV